jgi:hypothetical protein
MADTTTNKGGPTYDATIDPANAAEVAYSMSAWQRQAAIHMLHGKTAAADAYSHYTDSQPNETSIALMGLADQYRLVDAVVQRKEDLPFPGVTLGPTPSFSRAPDTSPVIGAFAHFGHHAHQVESKRASRLRFGR